MKTSWLGLQFESLSLAFSLFFFFLLLLFFSSSMSITFTVRGKVKRRTFQSRRLIYFLFLFLFLFYPWYLDLALHYWTLYLATQYEAIDDESDTNLFFFSPTFQLESIMLLLNDCAFILFICSSE